MHTCGQTDKSCTRARPDMMSFMINLPRRLYLYLREVVYGEGHVWSTVAEGESDEDSGWSTSEEEEKVGAQRQTRRTKAKSDKKPNKKIKGSKKDTPPPVAPKPKNPSTSVSNTSLTPPSSPTNSEEKILHQSTFDEIPGQRPLKSYHRVHGPHGRRRPVRYSYLTATDTTENGV